MKNRIALAFDLAVGSGRVGLWRGESLLAQTDIGERETSSDRLLPVIGDLLDECEAGVSEIGDIVFTRGPGGYTGIRVGIAIARGLQKALRAEAYGYAAYDILLSAAPENEKAASVLDAGRSEYLVTERGEGLRHSIVREQHLAEFLGGYRGGSVVFATRKSPGVIEASGSSQTNVIDASDNVTELLYRYHLDRLGDGSSLVPVYAREVVE